MRQTIACRLLSVRCTTVSQGSRNNEPCFGFDCAGEFRLRMVFAGKAATAFWTCDPSRRHKDLWLVPPRANPDEHRAVQVLKDAPTRSRDAGVEHLAPPHRVGITIIQQHALDARPRRASLPLSGNFLFMAVPPKAPDCSQRSGVWPVADVVHWLYV